MTVIGEPTHSRDPAGPVLVVEDEEDFREVICLELRQNGFEVLEAGDSGSAWHLASSHPIKAVVTDIRLPGIDGKTLARQLRKATGPTVPIVAFTVVPLDEVTGPPFDAVLSKPDLEPVVRFLRRRLAGSLHEGHPPVGS